MKYYLEIISILLFVICNIAGYSQYGNVDVSQEKFEKIFNNRRDIFNIKLDESILWNNSKGKEFLLSKLNSENSLDRILAINYLSRSNDKAYVRSISTLLSDSNEQVVVAAIQALNSFSTRKSIRHLEKKLLKSKNGQNGIVSHLLLAIKNFTSVKSLRKLKKYSRKIQKEESQNLKLLQEVIDTRKVIVKYNTNVKEQREYVQQMLFSKNIKKINWAMFKIRQAKDEYYLPQLRMFQKQVESQNLIKKSRVITLRKELGEKDFEPDELFILKEKENAMRLRIENTKSFLLQKDEYRHPIKDF